MAEHRLEPLDAVDDRRVLGVEIRSSGGEVIVGIRLSDGGDIELGRVPLEGPFLQHWSLEKWTRRGRSVRGLPLREMLRDANAAWQIHVGNGDHFYRRDLWGDLACHVRALVAEVEWLEGELAEADRRRREGMVDGDRREGS